MKSSEFTESYIPPTRAPNLGKRTGKHKAEKSRNMSRDEIEKDVEAKLAHNDMFRRDKEFKSIDEGVDKSPQDIKDNHPEIWEFFKKTGGWMSFDRYGKVETYNTGGQHIIVINIQPTASIENLKMSLDAANISYQSMLGGEALRGVIPDTNINFNVNMFGNAGNRGEKWLFGVPHEDGQLATYHDRTMEDKGVNDDRYHAYVYELVDYAEEYLHDIVGEFGQHAAGDSETPAAPDTSKFKAQVKGMIEVVKNQHVHGGQYGFDKNFVVGIKVGGNVDSKVREAIRNEVKRFWAGMLEGNEDHSPEIVQGNGLKTEKGLLHYDETSGTAWSMYGFVIS